MAQDRLDLVERAWRAYVDGGGPAAEEFFTEDVRWHAFPEAVGQSLFSGHEGQRELRGEMDEMVDGFEMRRIELRDAGDRVVMLAEMGGTIKGSDTAISQRIGLIYGDFRDGRIGEVHTYQTWPEALEAAGLEEESGR
jgi:ketosteroid isomerase-like protein